MIYEDYSWPEDEPGRYVMLHLAYYTGTVDTVPHVPERCYVAHGRTFMGRDRVTLDLDDAGYTLDETHGGYLYNAELNPASRVPTLSFDATRFTFEDQNSTTPSAEHVVYFFSANGQLLAGKKEVRINGFDPRDRYSYYCKIELMVPGVSDRDVAERRTEAFYSQALPEIMACLPDWVEVQAGEWPPTGVQSPSE